MPLRTGFQSFVNNELPIGVPGDSAGVNPRASVIAGAQGQYVAGLSGLTVGVFAWFDPVLGVANNYYKPGCVLGFVHRENNGLITLFLGIAAMQVVPGNICTGETQGDFIGLFTAGATPGQKVYANAQNGALSSAATGATIAGSYTASTVTASVLTTTDANLTGSAAAVGQVVTGGTLPPGTYIASAGAVGGGLHAWNLANVDGVAIPNQGAFTSGNFGIQETKFTVSSKVLPVATTDTGALAVTGILTIAGTITGTWEAGQFVAGAGIPVSANMIINFQISGTPGGAGTYQTSYIPPVAIANEAMTSTEGQAGVFTSWV